VLDEENQFALAIMAFMLLLGIIVDGGVAIWRHSSLTETINLVTVDRSIHLTQPWGLAGPNQFNVGSCTVPSSCGGGGLAECARDLVVARLGSFTTADPDDFTITVNNFPGNIHQTQLVPLSITAVWSADCYFCGLIGMDTFDITATGETTIEVPASTIAARCSDVGVTFL